MKKKAVLVASVLLSLFLIAAVVGTGVVLAASNDSYPPIVEKLAEKLNLKEDDVQSAFDEMKEEKQQEMQEKWEERLDEAVEDGKITEDQKEEILEKRTAIQQKQEEMHELKQELKSWADENDIDLREVMGLAYKGGLKGPRGRGSGIGGPGGSCFGPSPAQ